LAGITESRPRNKIIAIIGFRMNNPNDRWL
jgi:hypothetical protein